MAEWRATARLEKAELASLQRRKGRGGEVEGKAPADDMELEGEDGSKQAAGGAPSLTGPKIKDGSAGSQARNKGGTKGKGKGKSDVQSQLNLLAKATLANHDAIRELQANMQYVCIYGPEDNPLMKVHLDEGHKYYELKKLTLQKLEKAEPEQRSEALRALGPASASQFMAVVEAMVQGEPQAATPEHKHWTVLLALKGKLEAGTLHESASLAGTWVTKKAHGTSKKITARPSIEADAWSSMFLFFKQNGLKVFTGQKAPRDGVHRALQGLLD